MTIPTLTPLPVVRIGELPRDDQPQRWLVEQLWGLSSVGVIGDAPKCSKTWLGLDLALSVATGTACLGRYAVPPRGKLFAVPAICMPSTTRTCTLNAAEILAVKNERLGEALRTLEKTGRIVRTSAGWQCLD